MKTVFMASLFTLCCFAAGAQDTTLKEYVGKYIFPEGSVVPSADVTLKDTVLMVNSVQGASELKKMGKDTFMLVSFNGIAYFKRDAGTKVTGIHVEVGDILLDGIKEAGTTRMLRKQPADRPRNGIRK